MRIIHVIALLLSALIISITPVFATQLNLTYDANGNLQTGDGFYRTYNSLNQLWRVYNGTSTGGTLLQEYTYDPVEERVLVKDNYWSNGTIKDSTYYVSKEKLVPLIQIKEI